MSLGAEPGLPDRRRVAGQPRVLRAGLTDRGADALEGLVRAPCPRKPDADAEPGPPWHARRPVARAHRSRVDVVRPLDRRERRIALGFAVEEFLEPGQRAQDGREAADRVLRSIGRLRVGRNPGDLDLDPQHADAAKQHVQVGRLEHDHGVREHAGLARGERAVARALLLDNGQEAEFAGERVRHRLPQARDSEQAQRVAALHVTGAAPGQPAVGPRWHERIGRPQRGLRGNDVDVSVQQKRR